MSDHTMRLWYIPVFLTKWVWRNPTWRAMIIFGCGFTVGSLVA